MGDESSVPGSCISTYLGDRHLSLRSASEFRDEGPHLVLGVEG